MKNTSKRASKVVPDKKNAAYRVFAAILAALAVGVFFLPCITGVYPFTGGFELKKGFLFKSVVSMINGEAPRSLFNFFPAIYRTHNMLGLFANGIFYFFLLCAVITFILGVIAIFCKKKSPALLRVAAYFFAVGISLLTASEISYYYLALDTSIISLLTHNIFLLLPMGVALVIYFVLACAKLGKKVWMNLLNCVLAIIVCCALGTVFAKDMASFFEVIYYKLGIQDGKLLDIIEAAVCGLLIISFLLAAMRFIQKKGLVADLIRYIVMLLFAGFVLYTQIANEWRTPIVFIIAIVATAVALIQVLVCILQIVYAKATKKKAIQPNNAIKEEKPVVAIETPAVVTEEPAEEEVYVRDEYAEAIPYEGGPVEGVELAEEIVEETSTVIPEATPAVETADYDYYNSRSFDPFIATLSTEERNQFTELYILKYKGTMSEIPEYEVGGNNKEFFRKVFIYLGQYRDRIPDGLLFKMYEFASKL